MNEDFLHYLWRFKLWNKPIETTDGKTIRIFQNGVYNTDGGPDFQNTKIQIGSTTWAGHVEIHIKASDWYKHKHHVDPAYNNVILHVALQMDCEVKNKNGQSIPSCCIADKFDLNTFSRYDQWLLNKGFIACEGEIHNTAQITRKMTFEKLCIERLETKVEEIKRDLAYNVYSWEETFYQHLLKSFGLHINANSFYQLAKATPLRYLQKQSNNRFQLEAILLGQANLLDNAFKDKYPQALQSEYFFFRNKFRILPIQAGCMKFMRLRPCSFPTIRLSYFAHLIHKREQLFGLITDNPTLSDLKDYFSLSASDYWTDHYVFDKKSTEKIKETGQNTQELIIIHTIVPFLFAYGKYIDNETLCEKALFFLQSLPPEKNRLIKAWEGCRIFAENAGETQALLELKKSYCDHKKCLSCTFGIELLKR